MKKYVHVYNQLYEKIIHEEYPKDSKIPTEKELALEFSVSISTVRKALFKLRDQGLIISRPSSGYYVTDCSSQIYDLTTIDLVNSSTDITIKVLNFIIKKANLYECSLLQTKINTTIYQCDRINYVESNIYSYEIIYLPVVNAPSLTKEDLTKSLTNIIKQEKNIEIYRYEKEVKAISSNETIAKMLQIDEGIPILQVKKIIYAQGDEVLCVSYEYHRSQYLNLRINTN